MDIIKMVFTFVFGWGFKKITCPFCGKKFRGEADIEEGYIECPFCGKKWGI